MNKDQAITKLREALEAIEAHQTLSAAWRTAYQALAETEQMEDGWRPISTAPSKEAVFIYYRNSFGNGRVVKARYTPAFTEEYDGDGDPDDSWLDNCVENETYYYKAGWWEIVDNHDDFGCFPVKDSPTHWMPLPSPPKETEQ